MKRVILSSIAIFLGACASTTTLIPNEWRTVPHAPAFATLSLDDHGSTGPGTKKDEAAIHVDANRILNGDKVLTEAFDAVDSFDYSQTRGEVAFSVKRHGRDNFDIGLVSSDGSPIVWIPSPDPSDETGVQWAPRGHKISYIVRAKGGDVVRTVHIPTSQNVVVDFPNATIHVLAWEPAAERYAVVYSTPVASDAIEVVKYDGSSRKITTAPAETVEAEIEPFSKDAILLRPRDIAYDEQLPLVVWIARDFAWSDERAALIRNARVAVALTKSDPDDAFWSAAADRPWLSRERVYVVGGKRGERGKSLIADETVPADRSRRAADGIHVHPSVIQSFAAGFIADDLKRNPPGNVRSR
jgi:hypothetical protein